MTKLLIVEDERLEREGLLGQLDWNQYGIEDVTAATTGVEALEIIQEDKPDILMTDIKMPLMDGLELVQEARKIDKDIKVIFISGYDSFEFAQYAIKLNVCGYLLKPVDTDELSDMITQVVSSIDKDKQSKYMNNLLNKSIDESRSYIINKMITDLLYGTYDDEVEIAYRADFIGLNFIFGKYILLLVEIDDYALNSSSNDRMYYKDQCNRICQIARKYSTKMYNVEAAVIDLHTCAVLISCDSKVPSELIGEKYVGIGEKMISSVKDELHLSISIGASDVITKLSSIRRAYDDCCSALKSKIYKGKGRINKKVDTRHSTKFRLQLEHIDVELSKSLVVGDRTKIINTIDHMFDTIEDSCIIDNVFIQNLCINIISRMNITVIEMGLNINEIFGGGAILLNKLMSFETILDIRQWMKNIFCAVIEYNQEVQNTTKGDLKLKFKKFINKHYNEDITLKALSELWHYSPNYLGNMIKQEMGKGFSEYLAEYRMSKATMLLLNEKYKIYEVAHMVGYKNISSFIKQFKHVYNMTPNEYRTKKVY